MVGWFNAFIPGGGEVLLDDWTLAAAQSSLEIGTFAWGYSLSAKSPLTLDGVPENIPNPHLNGLAQIGKNICSRRNSHGICIRNGASVGSSPYTGLISTADISEQIKADFLQEVGIKTHFVDVFNSYRKAGATGQVDQEDTSSLFLAPFRYENLSDSYVLFGLLVSLGFHTYLYLNEGVTPTAPLNASSNTQYGLMYTLGYPVGSAAPEEMFYRGFLQNEFLGMTGSPYLAVPLSSAAYLFSHSSDSYMSAGVSGLYLGSLTYLNNGKLSKGIAFHFWSDIIMGIHAILSLQRNEHPSQTDLAGANVSLIQMKFDY